MAAHTLSELSEQLLALNTAAHSPSVLGGVLASAHGNSTATTHQTTPPQNHAQRLNEPQKHSTHKASMPSLLTELHALGIRTQCIDPIAGTHALCEPFTALDAHALQNACSPWQLHYLPITDSTNSYLLRLPDDGQWHIAIAEFQTQGRGRSGSWHARLGSGLLCSLRIPNTHAPALSLYVGLQLLKSLQSALSLESALLSLKWPNDVLLNEQKVAGILVERTPKHTIIGLGLNISDASKLLAQDATPSTHLFEHCSHTNAHRQGIIEDILNYLTHALSTWLEHSADAPSEHHAPWHAAWLAEWQQNDTFHNRPIRLYNAEGVAQTGICRGVNAHGELRLETPEGNVHIISTATRLRAHETTD